MACDVSPVAMFFLIDGFPQELCIITNADIFQHILEGAEHFYQVKLLCVSHSGAEKYFSDCSCKARTTLIRHNGFFHVSLLKLFARKSLPLSSTKIDLFDYFKSEFCPLLSASICRKLSTNTQESVNAASIGPMGVSKLHFTSDTKNLFFLLPVCLMQ